MNITNKLIQDFQQRKEANIALAKILLDAAELHPELRFSQILLAYQYVTQEGPHYWSDEFYIESTSLLKRVQKQCSKILPSEENVPS